MSDTPSHLLPDLDAHLGYWLRHVSNHVSRAFSQALQARQVSVAEWVALRQIYAHPDISSAELAELLGMTRGAISKILDKLEGKGFVACLTRAEDKRSQMLSLTPQGVRLLPELAELADQNDARHFACLSAAEQSQLRQLLQKMAHTHQWSDVPID